jgi:sugar/nucleoside kinase (ribokinase family)
MIRIVGAVCIDIVARRDAFVAGTSNPSQISVGVGGVGYRVYRSLCTAGRLLTAIGDDALSGFAARELAADPSIAARVVAAAGPPLYVALMERGRLAVGVSQLSAVERLEAADVFAWIGEPAPADLLVMDANLAPQLVGAIADRFAGRTRLVLEPVSVEKAARCRTALHDLFLVTPTEEEAAALCDTSDFSEWMRERRVAHAVVTRGPAGAELRTGGERRHFAPTRVVAAPDTTGAGDRLLAAMLDGLERGLAVPAALQAAMQNVETWLEEGSA